MRFSLWQRVSAVRLQLVIMSLARWDAQGWDKPKHLDSAMVRFAKAWGSAKAAQAPELPPTSFSRFAAHKVDTKNFCWDTDTEGVGTST